MRYLVLPAVILAMMLVAGCTTGHNGTYGNRDYARNCGNAMDEIGMCNGYLQPHEF